MYFSEWDSYLKRCDALHPLCSLIKLQPSVYCLGIRVTVRVGVTFRVRLGLEPRVRVRDRVSVGGWVSGRVLELGLGLRSRSVRVYLRCFHGIWHPDSVTDLE